MTSKVVLETERLRLREFAPEDLNVLAALLADPKVMRFWPRPQTRDEAAQTLERIMANYRLRGHSVWAVEIKDTGEFIGRCGLIPQTIDGINEFEVAYMIASSKWRQGFGSEAAIGIRDWAFEHLDVQRVISMIMPENVASIGVALKNGMRLVGATLHYGDEHVVYAINRSEWEALPKGLSVPVAEPLT